MAVRVMARKAAGTRSMRAPASSVQVTLASAWTSTGGTKVRLDSRTLIGARRSRLSVLLPRSIFAAECTAKRPITSSPGGSLRAAVDGHHDPVGGVVAKWMDVPHYERIDADAADHAVGHAPDHAVLDGAHAERPQHYQVIVGCGDVVDQAFPVLAVERLVFEG